VGKSLVITEKPSVARDIVAALGGFREQDGYWESDGYLVTFSVGHLLELLPPEEVDPKYKRWTLDTLPILPERFVLREKSGVRDRVRAIRKLIQRDDVDEVVNACDAGREGELIFREILEYLECAKPVRRLWLQSMTPEALRSGFQQLHPGSDYDALGAAARCRSQSDWLIGMNATRALTRRLQARKERTAWSAGRVQTPTLALVVDRELEVLAHVPRPYFRLEARFAAAGHEYAGVWFDPEFREREDEPDLKDDRIFDEHRARQILDAVQGRDGVASETRRPSRETAPPLFDLTSLQREGNRRFGWSARRTLNAAQRCYEAHKVLTYPRTDSRALPADYRATVDEVLRAFASEGPYRGEAATLLERGLENTERTFDNSKVSDHFAIIPTGRLPDQPLSGDDGRLYDLVARRFMASFYPAAVWTRVERVTEVATHRFRSRSRTLDEPGWRTVIGQTEQEDQPLPPLAAGQTEAEGVGARTLDVVQHDERTRPPARISEARLLSLMENAGEEIEDEDLALAIREKGIGTPATRADIIENLIQKAYLVRVGKALRPTVKGIRLVDVLRRIHIDRLASAELTGELEYQLSEVEHGRRQAGRFMNEIVEYTSEIVDRARSFQYEEVYPDTDALGQCPLCKRPVYERGWFYRCKEQPGVERSDDCPFRIWKDKSGRYIDRATARTLLEKGETSELEGFTFRDGRTYQGVLRLVDGEVTLERVAGSEGERSSDTPEYEVDARPLGPCPRGCGSQVIETPTSFICEEALEAERKRAAARAAGERRTRPKADDPKPCPMVLPRTVCRREITREEALQYLREKKTEMLTDFISRFGRPFSARLFLKDNGRHGFEFAPRVAGPGRAPGRKRTAPKTGEPAPRKQAAAKTAARKGTVRKKGARKGTSRKKITRKPS
jgi:DNA topoisomerase-3